MEFRVLGPLQVMDDGADVCPTAPKLRRTLAVLVLRHNQAVPTDALIDEIWDENPPATALATLQTYVYKLRSTLWPDQPQDCTPLRRRPSGYSLEIDPSAVDVSRFVESLGSGADQLRSSEFASAAATLRAGLALWRGPLLADVSASVLLSAYKVQFEEQRLVALEHRIEADLHLGRYQELISELKQLVCSHPMHEAFYGHLLIALHRSGRRGEALEAYRQLRSTLVDELGLDPSPAIQEIHQWVLGSDDESAGMSAYPAMTVIRCTAARADASVDEGRPVRPVGVSGSEETPAPERVPAYAGSRPERVPAPAGRATPPRDRLAQLPTAASQLLGREDDLEEAVLAARRDVTASSAGAVVAVVGEPGVGKSEFALHLARRLADRNADCELYVDLAGSTDEPADPGDVLAELLVELGLDPKAVPDGPTCRSRAFRGLVAGRRVLLMLDDAASAEQVRALLPASPAGTTIVTGGHASLCTLATVPVRLEPLEIADAMAMLSCLVGRERVRAERAAAEELCRLCGRLPLVLSSACTRLAATPSWPIVGLVRLLAHDDSRIDELNQADVDLAARIGAPYRRLGRSERSALRLSSLFPDGQVTVRQLGDLMGLGDREAERVVRSLAATRFAKDESDAGDEPGAFRLPELVRMYARSKLSETLGERRPDGRDVAAASTTVPLPRPRPVVENPVAVVHAGD